MSSSPQKLGLIETGELSRGFATQARVIGALILRELHTRYGRENIGYLWVILEPMMLAGVLAVIHGSAHAKVFGSNLPVVPFTIIGYTMFIIFRGIFTRAAGALESNMPLFYHRVISIFDVLASRALLEFAGVGMTLVILIGLAYLIGVSELPYRPLHLVAAMALMTWFGFGISMLICSATYASRIAERLVHPISYLMMPLSGVFFLLEWLPEPYQTLLSYFPLTLILEQARYGMFKIAPEEFVFPTYVVGMNLFITLLGLLALRLTRRNIHLS